MSGEAHSRAHLGLPGRQQDLVDALAATGKPLVAVLICGRPLVVPRLAEQADALLLAWHGGIRAGRAVADVLFGASNPSGKLSASWPRTEGQIPVYYAHKPTGRPAEGAGTTQYDVPFRSTYMDEPNSPLFSFGQGLSYSTLRLPRPEGADPRRPAATASCRSAPSSRTPATGRGRRSSSSTCATWSCSVTRPVKELKGFQRSRSGRRRGARGGLRGARPRTRVATASTCAIPSNPAASRCG